MWINSLLEKYTTYYMFSVPNNIPDQSFGIITKIKVLRGYSELHCNWKIPLRIQYNYLHARFKLLPSFYLSVSQVFTHIVCIPVLDNRDKTLQFWAQIGPKKKFKLTKKQLQPKDSQATTKFLKSKQSVLDMTS